MNPFEIYVNYLALKRHFNSPNYNYRQYNGKVKASIHSFEKRRDKYKFIKLSKHSAPLNFLLANIVNNSEYWVGDETGEKIYQDWRKRIESLSYNFKQDLEHLKDNLQSNFQLPTPYVFQLYVAKKISLETFTILLDYWSVLDYSDTSCDPLFREKAELARKYLFFLKYSKDNIIKLLSDRFHQED